MESDGPVDHSLDVAHNEMETLTAGRKRRRSLRGRRSSIKVVTDESSPGVLVAPLSESISRNTAVDPVTQLVERKAQMVAYTERLKAEKIEWDRKVSRGQDLLARARRIAERPLERKPPLRMPVEELGRVDSTPHPHHIWSRVRRKFDKQHEVLHDQKIVNKLRPEHESLAASIAHSEKTAACLRALLLAEPREELLAQQEWWESVKDEEERRMVRLREKLTALKARETLLNLANSVSSQFTITATGSH